MKQCKKTHMSKIKLTAAHKRKKNLLSFQITICTVYFYNAPNIHVYVALFLIEY